MHGARSKSKDGRDIGPIESDRKHNIFEKRVFNKQNKETAQTKNTMIQAQLMKLKGSQNNNPKLARFASEAQIPQSSREQREKPNELPQQPKSKDIKIHEATLIEDTSSEENEGPVQ